MIIGAMSEPAIDSAPTPALVGPTEGVVRLTDWGVIRAQGRDAATFLQGQLTNDVVGLAAGTAALAGYCSPKGRLLASFVVWSPGADEYLLACSADLLAPTLKRLSMFVLRAQCKLSDASAEWSLWGLAGDAAGCAAVWSVASDPAGQTIQLPPAGGVPRALRCQPSDAPAPPGAALDASVWRWLEVHSGVVRVVASTVEQFVPQMVNFELVGGVSFKKGCYPGQEVVARSQYRGTLKRRALLLALPPGTAATLQEGQEVFHDADPDQPAGMVALAARHPSGEQIGLVEVKLAMTQQGGQFRLGSADGPAMQPRALPYALPTDAD
jgi:hypothetical protein